MEKRGVEWQDVADTRTGGSFNVGEERQSRQLGVMKKEKDAMLREGTV